MNRTSIYLTILAFISCIWSTAQDYNYYLHNLSVEEGLSQNYVYEMQRDANGFTWISTQAGIDRFDGIDLKTYKSTPGEITSISSSSVRIIYPSETGEVWFGHEDGSISRYDPTHDEIKRSFFINEGDTVLIKSAITGIVEFGSDLLITSSNDGLFKWTPEKDVFEPLQFNESGRSRHVSDLIISSTGQVMILSDSSIYWSSDLESWSDIRVELAPGGHQLSKILDLGKGIFIATSFTNLYKIDLNEVSSSIIESELSRIVDVEPDDRGNVWAAGFEYVARFNPSRPEDVFYPTKLQGLAIKSLAYFGDGMLWAGTTGRHGLFWFDPYPPFEYISNNSSGYGEINMLSPMNLRRSRFTDSLIWMADLEKIIGYVPRRGQVFEINSPGLLMDFIERSPNEVYLCVDEIGMQLVDLVTGEKRWIRHQYHHAYPYTLGAVRAVCHDNDNMVWIGDIGACARFDPQTESFEAVIVDSVPALATQTMSIIQGADEKMWFGRKNGLFRYDPKTQDLIHYRLYPNTNVEIYSLYESNGTLWVGTKGFGVLRIDLEKSNLESSKGLGFDAFTTEDGLSNDVIYGILEDGESKIWLSTNRGLCHLDPKTGAINNYDMEDGLQHNEFNFRAYCEGYEGRMYFGGIRGVSAFYPKEVKRDQKPPIVRITDIRINAMPWIGEIHPNEIDHLELSYDENTISLATSVIHYRDPSGNQLKYRIKELDSKWTEVGDDRIIRLFNLTPGDYTIEMAAANSHGVWDHNAHKLSLTILPPWWQTTMFRVLLVVAILLLLFTGFYLRTRYLIAQRKKLEEEINYATAEIAQQKETIEQSLKDNEALLKEMHHRVKNNLTVLSGLLQLQENQVLDPEASQVLKDSINRINSIALIHQNLYQHEEMAHIMADEIVGELAKTVVDAQAKNDIELEVECESIELEIMQAVPIAMIINELITNSCKYAFKEGEKGKVGVKFSKASVANHFQLDVYDSGPGLPRGFDLKEAKTMGLRLVYILSKQLYARYTYRYKPYSSFTFVIPQGSGEQPKKA